MYTVYGFESQPLQIVLNPPLLKLVCLTSIIKYIMYVVLHRCVEVNVASRLTTTVSTGQYIISL